MARTRMAIATPSSMSSGWLYSEEPADKSGASEALICCDWLASGGTVLTGSMIYICNTQSNIASVQMKMFLIDWNSKQLRAA